MGRRPPPQNPLVRDVREKAAAAYGCHGSHAGGGAALSRLWEEPGQPAQRRGKEARERALGEQGDCDVEDRGWPSWAGGAGGAQDPCLSARACCIGEDACGVRGRSVPTGAALGSTLVKRPLVQCHPSLALPPWDVWNLSQFCGCFSSVQSNLQPFTSLFCHSRGSRVETNRSV